MEAQPDQHSLLYLPYPTGVPGDRFRQVLPAPQVVACTVRCPGTAASGRSALACLLGTAQLGCPNVPVLPCAAAFRCQAHPQSPCPLWEPASAIDRQLAVSAACPLRVNHPLLGQLSCTVGSHAAGHCLLAADPSASCLALQGDAPLGTAPSAACLPTALQEDPACNPHSAACPFLRCRELYYWDSYWVLQGLLVCGMTETATSQVRDLMTLLQDYGHVPNGARRYYLNRR